MGLRGTAVLAIWNDIDESMEEEFNRWHTFEHIPERVLTPGALAGRRYHALSARDFRYFTLYEVGTFGVFESDGYLSTANTPSAWSARVLPAFYNFIRAPSHIVMTRGSGLGGALATIRITFPEAAQAGASGNTADIPANAFNLATRHLIDTAMAMPGVVAAHACIAGAVNRTTVRKRPQRSAPSDRCDAVLLIEGYSRPVLEGAVPMLSELMRGTPKCVGSFGVEVYDLACYMRNPQE
ncbi:MAG: hypothetical protein IT516_08535 [Burkholderiales bacterium]|nr:hypothetical protein [Burkholderiales bacterium]